MKSMKSLGLGAWAMLAAVAPSSHAMSVNSIDDSVVDDVPDG